MLVFLLSQYTQKKLEFAPTVDPKNEALVKKMTWVQQQRKDKKTTEASTIGDGLEFNPFIGWTRSHYRSLVSLKKLLEMGRNSIPS
jgi:hypothetical protein